MTNPTLRYDLDEIRRAVSILLEPGQVYEIRSFGRGTTSGYFDNFLKLVESARRLSGTTAGVYVTINPVLPDLLSRSDVWRTRPPTRSWPRCKARSYHTRASGPNPGAEVSRNANAPD